MRAADTPVPELYQLLEPRRRHTIGGPRQRRFACIDVDGCACENEPAYLAGIPRGIGKRHPAALTHSYQIGVAAELVHNNVEISKVAVNWKRSAFRGSPSANPSQTRSSAQLSAAPQRDCGPVRNQSAWRHEAQAVRRPRSQCRRHPLKTCADALRAIRAQSGSALSISAGDTWRSGSARRADAQVLW